MPSRLDIANQIVLICHRLYERGFVTATDGNVSARIANGNILTTPSSINKGKVNGSDLVEVTLSGSPVTIGRKPSTELGMHLYIYEQRPDVGAVVHAHPTYATGFATARIPLTGCLFPEVIVGLGAVPLARYATPSTREVAESLAPFVHSADVILLANHGVVAYGADVEEAYYKLEKVEHAAHITFVAKLLGGEQVLTHEEVDRLRSVSQASYGKDPSTKLACETPQREDLSERAVKELIRQVLQERTKREN